MTNEFSPICIKKLICPALALAITLFMPIAGADTSGIMYVSGKVRLTENHNGMVVLDKDGAFLDCDGHYIRGGDKPICGRNSDKSCGVFAEGLMYAQVRNCHIIGSDIGIFANYTHQMAIKYNTIQNNTVGIYMSNSIGNYNSPISNNKIENDDEGIKLRSSINIWITGNLIAGNGRDGIDINGGSDNVIQHNGLALNGYNGIELDESPRAIIEFNEVVNNGGIQGNRSGISLDGSDECIINENNSKLNARNGIRIDSGTSFCTITNNTATGNSVSDLHQDPASVGNIWSGNTFNTKTGF